MSSRVAGSKKSVEDGLKLGLECVENGSYDKALDAFCTKYQINPEFKSKLDQLKNYKIVLIADDSGSMRAESDANLEGIRTRWDEMHQMCRLLIELYAIFNPEGIDVHFLNQEDPMKGVKTVKDKRLVNTFKQQPAGPTPICNILTKVLNDEIQDPRIIIIATDGEPTTMDGKTSEVRRLRQILANRNASRNFVSIVACTGDDDVLAYLNNWDVAIANLDVVDDFRSERAEVLRAQGDDFQFNYADYVIKLVLGAVDPYFDRLDELTAARREILRQQGCNCTIL